MGLYSLLGLMDALASGQSEAQFQKFELRFWHINRLGDAGGDTLAGGSRILAGRRH